MGEYVLAQKYIRPAASLMRVLVPVLPFPQQINWHASLTLPAGPTLQPALSHSLVALSQSHREVVEVCF